MTARQPLGPVAPGPTWAVPATVPPRVQVLGAGFHGGVPEERFTIEAHWSVHLYRYAGTLSVEVSGHTIEVSLQPGSVSVVPAGVTYTYRFTEPSVHLFAHVWWPDPGSTGDAMAVPFVRMLPHFEHWYRRFEQALTWWTARPAAAQALLWDLLCELAAPEPTPATDLPFAHFHHPALGRALHLIETRFHERLTIAGIAHEVGISHNHLTRLFRDAFDTTVIGYLRQRRVARARELLVFSDRPIKAIAAEVGIPDLHAFNKTLRTVTGRSPRDLRAGVRRDDSRRSERGG